MLPSGRWRVNLNTAAGIDRSFSLLVSLCTGVHGYGDTRPRGTSIEGHTDTGSKGHSDRYSGMSMAVPAMQEEREVGRIHANGATHPRLCHAIFDQPRSEPFP